MVSPIQPPRNTEYSRTVCMTSIQTPLAQSCVVKYEHNVFALSDADVRSWCLSKIHIVTLNFFVKKTACRGTKSQGD